MHGRRRPPPANRRLPPKKSQGPTRRATTRTRPVPDTSAFFGSPPAPIRRVQVLRIQKILPRRFAPAPLSAASGLCTPLGPRRGGQKPAKPPTRGGCRLVARLPPRQELRACGRAIIRIRPKAAYGRAGPQESIKRLRTPARVENRLRRRCPCLRLRRRLIGKTTTCCGGQTAEHKFAKILLDNEQRFRYTENEKALQPPS